MMTAMPMRLAWLVLAGLALAPGRVVAAAAAPAAGRRPNVLVIISDDQGYSDFGFTGNPRVRTPALDRLASEGAVFRNVVVAAACSPTRAAIYTGREHLSTGVWGVPPRANLRRDEALLPAFFKAAGYRTLHVGKADCTRTYESQPWQRGWDDAFLVDGGYVHRDPILTHKDGSGKVEGWTADLVTDRALEFIRGAGDEPWLATVAYIIPHLPWVCDEAFSAPFRQQGLSPQLAACYGAIAQLDAAVGRLLAGLREAGQEDRTVVLFISDNGMTDKDPDSQPLSAADWEIRNPHRLRGHKATVWENGIRVPMVVRWPGRIAPGDRPQFGCAEDILPTLLDLARVPAEGCAHQPFTGVSLRAALEDPASVDHHRGAFRLAIAFAGSPRAPTGIIPDPRALRYEDHHLVLREARFKFHALPGGETALYDLAADPSEETDVRGEFPEVAARLGQECRQRWDEVLAGGRAFGMPVLLVGAGAGLPAGGRRSGASLVPASAAQALTGRVRVVAQTAQGFAAAGDSARYALDVRTPGRYQVMLRGQALDACAPLRIDLAGRELSPVKGAPTAISFGVVTLDAGPVTLIIAVAADRPDAVPATLKDVALTPVVAAAAPAVP